MRYPQLATLVIILSISTSNAEETAAQRLEALKAKSSADLKAANEKIYAGYVAALPVILELALKEGDSTTAREVSKILNENRSDIRGNSVLVEDVPMNPREHAALKVVREELAPKFTIAEDGTLTARYEDSLSETVYLQLKSKFPLPLTVDGHQLGEADALNGLSWKGMVTLAFTSYRVSKRHEKDGVPVWDEWQAVTDSDYLKCWVREIKGHMEIDLFALMLRLDDFDPSTIRAAPMLPDFLDDSQGEDR